MVRSLNKLSKFNKIWLKYKKKKKKIFCFFQFYVFNKKKYQKKVPFPICKQLHKINTFFQKKKKKKLHVYGEYCPFQKVLKSTKSSTFLILTKFQKVLKSTKSSTFLHTKLYFIAIRITLFRKGSINISLKKSWKKVLFTFSTYFILFFPNWYLKSTFCIH